ncbi:MAG: hypothetical protein Fur006_63360 [Coleofasciculaceae cyanobacterium]
MEVSNPQVEEVTRHPLETVIQKLDYLLESLKLEVEVAPTDRKAHQDLLRRTIQVCEVALQIHDEAWPVSLPAVPGEAQVMTQEDKEWIESVDWIKEGELGKEIDVDAMNKRLKERGSKIQLSFPETPES